jgi:beta-mannanase
MMRVALLLVPLALITSAAATRALEPANPKANVKTKAILNFFEDLSKRPDKRVVSGQFTDYGPNASARLLIQAHEKTGHWPGMIGLDAYTDNVDRAHIKGYEEIVALGKPFGFTEFGPHGSQNPPGNYDYRRFIEGITKDFPKTTFFLCWHGNWSISRNQYGKELLEHPWVINREAVSEVVSPKGK